MVGRIYDPTLGRFLQADPFIQAPSNTQNYNRYSYVLNNLMSYTDPSGYFANPLKKIGRNLIQGASKVFGSKIVSIAGNVASIFCGPYAPACSAAWNYEFARAHDVSSSGALKIAAISAATTYAFQQIGETFSNIGADNIDKLINGADFGVKSFGGNLLTTGQALAQITAHAMVGGVAAQLSGGSFGHGFISAGVTKGAGGIFLPGGSNLTSKQIVSGSVISAVIGGTVSSLTGGKFANGAQTAAMQYLYNQLFSNFIDEQKNRWHAKRKIKALNIEMNRLSCLYKIDRKTLLLEFRTLYGFKGNASDLRSAYITLHAELQTISINQLLEVQNGGAVMAIKPSANVKGVIKTDIGALLKSWPLFFEVGEVSYYHNYSCPKSVCTVESFDVED